MPDKKDTKPSNVKPLFEGIKIDQEEDKPLEPQKHILSWLEEIKEQVENGQLRSLIVVEEYADIATRCRIVGEVLDVADLNMNLDIMKNTFLHNFCIPFYAAMNGFDDEDYEE